MNMFLSPMSLNHRAESLLEIVGSAARGEFNADNDGYEPLSNLVRQAMCELEADGVLVAWHVQMHEPLKLVRDGDCLISAAVEHDMIEAASEAVRGCTDSSRWDWCAAQQGSGGLLTTSIPLPDGIVTLTAKYRKARGTARLRAGEAAARLIPLLQPFFLLWVLRFKMLSRVRGFTAAINNSDVATLLVNRYGQLLFANGAAEALIAINDGLRCSGSMLSGTKLADTLRLQAAIEHVVSIENDGTAVSAAPVVALARESRRPLLAAVVANNVPVAGNGDSVATVYVVDPEEDLRARLEPACKLYGLSPVETDLTCLLADGKSLTDAADRMRVREQTARSYLKQIFLKTDTNRQAELVWLMLKSAVRTAPGCRTAFV